MTPIVFDETYFRAEFAYFNDPLKYPTGTCLAMFTLGSSYVNPSNQGWALVGADLQNACFLMTAHLLALNDLIAANNGASPALVKEASVDKVRISLNMPPAGSQFQWWMNLTPWGAQLLALLGVKSAGGYYTGGLPERAAFRRVGGGFGARSWM